MSRAPLLPLTACFALGILLADLADYAPNPSGGILAIGLGLVWVLHQRPRPQKGYAYVQTALLLLIMTAAGTWYAGQRHPPNDDAHLIRHTGDTLTLTATVIELRPPGQLRRTATLEVNAYLDSTAAPARGKLIAYLPGDARSAALRPGNRLLLRTRIDSVTGPRNPGTFDYRAYLAGQQIYHRCYPDSAAWQPLTTATPGLKQVAATLRAHWLDSFAAHLEGEELAVAAALVLGQRDLLDADLRDRYADTGAIHVLAVSGLHVGIVALIFAGLLRLLPVGRYLRTALIVTGVWGFALVTGLSPSVQRAALMLTVVLAGRMLHRDNSVFNLLAAAALAMLVAAPSQLFQVGFQLSFAAVAGIVLFARRLRTWAYLPGARWTGLARDAVCVSVAAQLGTLPLSLYYFGQFPLYFMVSGTLVIVFAYVVLALGLLHGALAALGLPLAPTGWLLKSAVSWQNGFIEWCSRLPGAKVELTEFSLFSCLALSLLIGLLAYLAHRPHRRVAWASAGLGTALCTYWIVAPAYLAPPPHAIIYHLPWASLIDVYDGRHGYTIGDSLNDDHRNYQIEPARRRLASSFTAPHPWRRDTSCAALATAYPLLRLLDHRVLVLDGKDRWPSGAITLPEVDLILVRNGFYADRLALPDDVPIVVDGSNRYYRRREWHERYPRAHLTHDRGAYVFKSSSPLPPSSR